MLSTRIKPKIGPIHIFLRRIRVCALPKAVKHADGRELINPQLHNKKNLVAE